MLASGNLTSGQRLSITVDKVIGTLHILTTSSDAILGVFSESVPRRAAFEVLESMAAFVKEQVSPDLVSGATKEGELNRFCKDHFKEVRLQARISLSRVWPPTNPFLISLPRPLFRFAPAD